MALGAGSDFGWAVEGVFGTLAVGAPSVSGGRGRDLVFPAFNNGGVSVLQPTQTIVPSQATDRRFGHVLTQGQGRGASPGSFNNRRLAVGAPGSGDVRGAVYVYRVQNGGSGLTQLARLEGPPGFGSAASLLNGQLAVASPGTGEVYVYDEQPEGDWALTLVLAASADVPAGRLGAEGVALLPSADGALRVLASTAAPTAGAAPAPPVVFLPTPFGPTRVEPVAILADSATGLYGSALAVSTGASFFFALGDPAASGTGVAFVVPGATLPVGSDSSTPPTIAVSIRVFPTPVNRSATLRLVSPGPSEVTVVDMLGREVYTAALGGSQDVTLDTAGLPSGLYAVRVATPAGTATARLVVAH